MGQTFNPQACFFRDFTGRTNVTHVRPRVNWTEALAEVLGSRKGPKTDSQARSGARPLWGRSWANVGLSPSWSSNSASTRLMNLPSRERPPMASRNFGTQGRPARYGRRPRGLNAPLSSGRLARSKVIEGGCHCSRSADPLSWRARPERSAA
jgi:hypothetical protein